MKSEWPVISFLLSIMSANSRPLPVIVPTFRVPTLTSTLLPFPLSHCLWTRFPRLVLLLRPAVAQFPLVPCWPPVPVAVVGNPGLDRSGMEIRCVVRIMISRETLWRGCHHSPLWRHNGCLRLQWELIRQSCVIKSSVSGELCTRHVVISHCCVLGHHPWKWSISITLPGKQGLSEMTM